MSVSHQKKAMFVKKKIQFLIWEQIIKCKNACAHPDRAYHLQYNNPVPVQQSINLWYGENHNIIALSKTFMPHISALIMKLISIQNMWLCRLDSGYPRHTPKIKIWK